MLDLVVMDTVAGAVVAMRAAAVVASLQVEAHRVVGAGVPPRLALIDIWKKTTKQQKHLRYEKKKHCDFISYMSVSD